MLKEIDKEIQKSVKNSNLRQDKFWGNSCFWRITCIYVNKVDTLSQNFGDMRILTLCVY